MKTNLPGFSAGLPSFEKGNNYFSEIVNEKKNNIITQLIRGGPGVTLGAGGGVFTSCKIACYAAEARCATKCLAAGPFCFLCAGYCAKEAIDCVNACDASPAGGGGTVLG